ncbi:MAG TPA: hypothetical protein VFQ85_14835 [Mycobacteriales bacterium]|nr:hypothetical protein [Mycobacteriales bacterium]
MRDADLLYRLGELLMKRSLSLKRETLAELSTDDLLRVAGGAATGNGLTCPVGASCVNELTLSCPERTCNCCTASASC